MDGCQETAENLAEAVRRNRAAVTLPGRRPGQGDFFRALFSALDESRLRYCVLHSWEGLPQDLPSDLDLAVHPHDVRKLPLVFQTLLDKGYQPVHCLNYAVKSYRFDFIWIEDLVPCCAGVDITYEYRACGVILGSGETLVAGRQRRGDFWAADPATEFNYLLGKKSHKGTVSARQEQRLKFLVGELGRRQAETIAARLFGSTWKERVVDACASGCLGGLLRRLRRRLWLTKLARNPLNPVCYLFTDGLRLIRRWLQPTGFFLVILGPDGVGKSTLLEQLAQTLSPVFGRQRVFHWRPGVIAEQKGRGPVTNPHGELPRANLMSVAYLFGLLLDYWLGFLFVIRPLLARATLVVFDRYFHDLPIDPRRYRYGGPLWLARATGQLVPQPEMMLILDAPVNVILSRKRELEQDELLRQRTTYQQLAVTSSNAIRINTDQSLRGVNTDATSAVAEYLAQRFERRHARWLTLG